MCNMSSEEMSGFPMGSGGQGRLSLHVSCCSVSFFQLLYVSCISMKVSEANTWLEEVGLCSIVVELCGNCAALSGSRQAVVECQRWWLWERCLGKDSTQAPQVSSMRGKMPSWKRLRPGLVFVWNKVYLVWSTYIRLWSEVLFRGVMLSVFLLTYTFICV